MPTVDLYKRKQLLIMGTLILYAALIAVFAVVYLLILAYEPILNWWFKFGSRFEKSFFHAPIWGCQLCFAGQTALWTYIFNWIASYLNANAPFWRFIYFLIPEYQLKDFSVLNGLIFISLAILITKGLSIVHEKYLK